MELKDFELYVEEINDGQEHYSATPMANCSACFSTVSSFSCPGGTLSLGTQSSFSSAG